MEIIFSLGNQLREYLVQWYAHSSYHLSSLISKPAIPAIIGKIANDIQIGSQYAIQNRSDIMKNVSIFIALSYVGVFFGGSTGLALGGIAGGLAAMGLLKWTNDSQLFYKIGSNARRFLHNLNLPNFITIAIISAALSFLCFMLEGRIDIAIGGLLGQAISYSAVEFKYVEAAIQNAKYIVFGATSVVSGLMSYYCPYGPIVIQTLTSAYGKLYPYIPKLVELMKSPHFLKIVAAMLITCLAAALVYLLYYLKRTGYLQGMTMKIRETAQESTQTVVQYVKSPHVIKKAAISMGVCFLIGLVTFGIYNWQIDLPTVHQKMKLTYEGLSPVVRQLSEYGHKTIEGIRKELPQIVDYCMKNPYFIKIIAGCIIACGIGLIAFIIYKGKYVDSTKVKAMLTQIHRVFSELKDQAIEKCLCLYLSIYFAVCDAKEFLSLFIRNTISQHSFHEMYTSLLQKLKELVEKLKTSAFFERFLPFFNKQMVDKYTEKLMKAVDNPEIVNGASVFAGFAVIGYLFGGLNGFFVGCILGGLILRGISQCPQGSTALGDAILDNLGISKSQTHWVNLFGTVYKLELPQEDISTVQQWEEHKQSAVFQSFLSLLSDKLKFKVSELNVKMNRSKDPTQISWIEPILTKNSPRNTVNPLQNGKNEGERGTTDSPQENGTQNNSPVNIEASGEKPNAVSMVSGP